MARDGSGTYSLPSGNPVTTGTTISSTTHNNTMSDIASALTASVAKDGQTTMTANLPMGGFKLTNLAAGSDSTDSVRLGQLQGETGVYVSTVGGTADAITLTPSPAITAYAAGQRFSFIASGANTTAVTVAVSGLSAQAVTKFGSTALVANNILSGMLVTIQYDGTRFQLLSPSILSGDVDFTGAVTVNSESQKAGQVISINATADGATLWAPGGHLYGLTLSNNTTDPTNDLDIAVGECTDDSRSYVMKLTSAITKRLDATWSVGTDQGGLDTGSIAVSTMYRVFLIMRPDTGVVDVLFSTSSSPTMPTNYTVKRRIGFIFTNSGPGIRAFYQEDDRFILNGVVNDVSASLTATASDVTLTAPPQTVALIRANIQVAGDTIGDQAVTYLYSKREGDVTPAAGTGNASLIVSIFDTGQSAYTAGHFDILMDANQQMRHDSALDTGVSGTLDIITYGWIDKRGRYSNT